MTRRKRARLERRINQAARVRQLKGPNRFRAKALLRTIVLGVPLPSANLYDVGPHSMDYLRESALSYMRAFGRRREKEKLSKAERRMLRNMRKLSGGVAVAIKAVLHLRQYYYVTAEVLDSRAAPPVA